MDARPVMHQRRHHGFWVELHIAGIELVADRATREPADEKQCAGTVAECAARNVIIGVTNRSVPAYNNTLTFSPALIVTEAQIDEISTAVDESLAAVFG